MAICLTNMDDVKRQASTCMLYSTRGSSSLIESYGHSRGKGFRGGVSEGGYGKASSSQMRPVGFEPLTYRSSRHLFEDLT